MGKRVQKRHRGRRRSRLPMILPIIVLALLAVLLVKSCGDGADAGNNSQAGDTTVQQDQNAANTDQQPAVDDVPDEPDPMEGYVLQTMTEADMGRGEQILVSNEHHYTFPEEIEEQLQIIISNKTLSYMSKDYETAALPVTVEHLNAMMDDFVAQGGSVSVMVVAGHRTYDYQQGLFDRSAARNGLEHAKRFVAQAGGSEHHTGYAIDLWSTTNSDYLECTGEYAWIGDNCHKYGFILRYEAEKEPYTKIGPEGWHFRYVGVPHAYITVENGFCYEEYIDYLRQYPFDGEHLTYAAEGVEYEIYFVEGLEVPVPETGEYTVSGNNVDGFIVTVTK